MWKSDYTTIWTFHTGAFWLHNNLYDFSALEHKFRTQKPVLKFVLKISGIQK